MTRKNKDMAPIGDGCQLFPPWGAPDQWREANAALNHLMAIHDKKLNSAIEAARAIGDRLKWLFPLLDTLCDETCPHCPDPCCLSAKIWVDFKDLLFLHLAGHPVPQVQLIADTGSRCTCISHRGCTLPRLSRPWVCTWYLCPAQTARLRRRPASNQTLFRDTVLSIKSLRNRMEQDFIQAVR
ncbi:MAG: hypothetical protein JEZ11_00760 [Desulfobacterales bacterium]|nr:hypothetical protein [Desulfobacterales bacterium]